MYFCVSVVGNEKSIREYDLFGDFKKKFIINGTLEIFKYGQFLGDQSNANKEAYNYSVGIEVTVSSEKIKIIGDVGGRSPIYYYSPNKNVFIASNSFLILKDCMKLFGFEIRPNYKIIKIQMADSWIFETAFSHQTLIDNVFLCSKNNYLQYTYPDGLAKEIAFRATEDFDLYSYPEAILKSAEHLRSVISLLISQYREILLSLSGGQDSRILFSAVLTLPENLKKKIKFKTGGEKNNSRDFLVAQSMCENYDLPHNEKIIVPIIQISDNHTINRWKHENVGWCYQNNLSNNYSVNNQQILSLRGGQIHATYYPQVLKKFLKSDLYKAVADDFEDADDIFLNGTNFSEFNDDFFNAHYGFFRYRAHYGRNNSLRTCWTSIEDPLINPWHEAANYLLPLKDRNLGGICRDMCLNLEPSVLNFEFDKIQSRIDNNYLRESVFYSNSKFTNIENSEFHISNYYDEIDPQSLPKSNNFKVSEIIFETIRNSFFVNKVIQHEKISLELDRYHGEKITNKSITTYDLKLYSLSLIFD